MFDAQFPSSISGKYMIDLVQFWDIKIFGINMFFQRRNGWSLNFMTWDEIERQEYFHQRKLEHYRSIS